MTDDVVSLWRLTDDKGENDLTGVSPKLGNDFWLLVEKFDGTKYPQQSAMKSFIFVLFCIICLWIRPGEHYNNMFKGWIHDRNIWQS